MTTQILKKKLSKFNCYSKIFHLKNMMQGKSMKLFNIYYNFKKQIWLVYYTFYT